MLRSCIVEYLQPPSLTQNDSSKDVQYTIHTINSRYTKMCYTRLHKEL